MALCVCVCRAQPYVHFIHISLAANYLIQFRCVKCFWLEFWDQILLFFFLVALNAEKDFFGCHHENIFILAELCHIRGIFALH